MRRARFTTIYLAILVATTCVLASVSATTADRLLLERSTNLHHLAHDPLRVLVVSAFWLSAPWQLLPTAILFLLVLLPVERRVGSLRTAAVFAAGHVGATLVVAAGVWVGLRLDLVDRAVVDARDVGVSYGLVAVAAAMTYLLDRRVRLVYAVAVASYLALALALSPTFTSCGHVVAFLIGIGGGRRALSTRASNHVTTPARGRPSSGSDRRSFARMPCTRAGPATEPPVPTRSGVSRRSAAASRRDSSR